jgi:mono/diheme cytochrome c family protein
MKRIVAALFTVAVATSAYADAAATYASKCAACHGKAGEGAKMAPKPIAGMPADKVKAAIVDGYKGEKSMKPVKIDDADDVAAYVAALKKP